MSKQGMVVLVGAGPGDAGLLTRKGAQELAKAEVVVYDRLVSGEIMALIPETAERINVGKNVGDHPVPQHEINQILLREALAGKYVVRLKGGDPFVFGRGGEELELLAAQGIPFEVVPGVTSALSAAAYAGIPVTHRDFCSSLHIITGHKRENGALSLDYDALVRLDGTLVFMMSVANAGEIAAGLMAHGMAEDTPCAVVENGTRPEQRKLVSVLGSLRADIDAQKIKSPAVILVGRVCTLSDDFDWFSKLPLKGRRILVTRPRAASARLAEGLRALGAAVTLSPAVRTLPIPFTLPDPGPYSWLVFTSAAGVTAYCDALFETGDARLLAGKKIAAVGTATAAALRQYGLRADFIPSEFCGEALANELVSQGLATPDDRLLLVRGKLASADILRALDRAGVPHDELTVYDTGDDSDAMLDPADFDLVTFTSASCADAFARHLKPGCDLAAVTAVCIGRQTAARAEALGMKPVISQQATIDSMIEKIKEVCNA